MDIREEFDSLRHGYTENISRWVPYYREMLLNLIQNLPSNFYPRTVVDLGCGNGNITALLIERFPKAEFILVDASPEMLEACEERFGKSSAFQYRSSFFQEVDFQDGSIDLVTAGLAIHHLQSFEKEALFSRIYSWLDVGGIVTMFDLYVDREKEPRHSEVVANWKRIAFQNQTTQEEWDWIMDHYDKFDHPDSFEDQIKWLQVGGFSTVKIPWNKEEWGNLQGFK